MANFEVEPGARTPDSVCQVELACLTHRHIELKGLHGKLAECDFLLKFQLRLRVLGQRHALPEDVLPLLIEDSDQVKGRLAGPLFLHKHRLDLKLLALSVLEVKDICRLPVYTSKKELDLNVSFVVR